MPCYCTSHSKQSIKLKYRFKAFICLVYGTLKPFNIKNNMKYLSDYISEKQTQVFNETGAFFAFSDKQFEEGKKEGIKYVHLGGGMLCPKDNASLLVERLDGIYKEGIKQDIEDNTIEGIIRRELSNHEAYYTGDIDVTFEAIKEYGVTREQVFEVYKREKNNQE